MSGCESVDAYLSYLTKVGFERVTVAGPTGFSTSATTLGFDFVAFKPASATRRGISRTAVAVAMAAAALGLAVVLCRRA